VGNNAEFCYHQPQRTQFYGCCNNISAGAGYRGRCCNFRPTNGRIPRLVSAARGDSASSGTMATMTDNGLVLCKAIIATTIQLQVVLAVVPMEVEGNANPNV
jgi:hypothetical protein